LNWLDYILILLCALSLAAGVAKGFAKQLIGLAAAVAGFLLALWFYGSAGSFLLPYVSHRRIANFLGFVGILVGVVILGAVIGKLLSMAMKWAGLSWLDRLAGAGFGLIRGLVFAIALVLALLAFTPNPPPRSVVRSKLSPYVIDAAHACAYLAPREVREAVADSYSRVKEAWDEFLRNVQRSKSDSAI
jgi:membrane protein required for colicin V production